MSQILILTLCSCTWAPVITEHVWFCYSAYSSRRRCCYFWSLFGWCIVEFLPALSARVSTWPAVLPITAIANHSNTGKLSAVKLVVLDIFLTSLIYFYEKKDTRFQIVAVIKAVALSRVCSGGNLFVYNR